MNLQVGALLFRFSQLDTCLLELYLELPDDFFVALILCLNFLLKRHVHFLQLELFR